MEDKLETKEDVICEQYITLWKPKKKDMVKKKRSHKELLSMKKNPCGLFKKTEKNK